MVRNSDDEEEDVGRLESQNILRNKNNSKYLNEVIKQSSMEYDEAVETIEREKKIIDSADQGFFSSLELSTHHKALEKARYRTNSDTNSTHDNEVDALLNASDGLMKLNRRATSAVSNAANGSDSYASYERSCKADQDNVKKLIVTGKRVITREINSLENATTSTNENDEINAQANAIFVGQRKDSCQKDDVQRPLKYMQKGVKKMAKGLGSDM